MDDLRTIAAKNVFLLITWEPIVPSSELRAEQIGPQCMIRELLFLKMCSFLSNGNQLFLVPNHERNRLVLYL